MQSIFDLVDVQIFAFMLFYIRNMSKLNLTYQLSKFVSIFRKDDVFCYYHSLKMAQIYLTQEQNEDIKRYLESNIETIGNRQIIECFRKNEFLVSTKEDEDFLFEKVKKNVLSPQLMVGYIVLTEACNLACNYCFLGNGKKSIEHNLNSMDVKVAEKSLNVFIQQSLLSCKDDGIKRNIIFYGGEPLINFKMLKFIIELYKQYRLDGQCPFDISFSIVTNGTLITDEIADYFKENEINVSLSLDGPTLKSNENRILQTTKKCAYNNIIKGLSILQNANCIFGLSYTLSEQSLEVSPKNLLHFLIENKIYTISFNTLICNDGLKSKTYYEKAASYIIDFWKLARKNHIFEDRMSRKIKAFATREFLYNDCAATSGCQLCFYPDSSIRICHGCKKGDTKTNWNIFEAENIRYMESDEVFDWMKYSPIFHEECKYCSAISICGGGCVLNKKANRDNQNIDLGFCIQTKKILEFLIWDLYKKLRESK